MRDPIFKGATRPVMWLGVPQMAFLGLMLVSVLGAMWSFILISGFAGFVVLLASVFVYGILRFVSADDPHRLIQRGMQMQSWFHARGSRLQWGAHSATPFAVKTRVIAQE